MALMRVVWKDSNAKNKKPFRYRGHNVTGCNGGWTVDIPGDKNIYRTHYCAQNAIDAALGGFGQMGAAKRKSYGIQIVGLKDNTTV